MQYVIFHGSFGNPQANWFPWLKEELEKIDQQALIPAFPVDTWDRITQFGENHPSEIQNLDNWTKTFEDSVLPALEIDQPLRFVGHSLASVFILHMVEKYNVQLDSAIFVAPFLEHLGRSWQIDVVNKSFYKTDFDFEKLQQLIKKRIAVFTDNDPYVPQEKFEEFVTLTKSETVVIPHGGHLNADTGFTTFPKLLDLCKTRM